MATITIEETNTQLYIGEYAGKDGVGIADISKTSSDGLVDTYTITYTDGTTSTFEVTNGAAATGGLEYSDIGDDGVVGTFVIPTSTDMTTTLPSLVAYVDGTRVSKDAEPHTFTASTDTYIDVQSDGTYIFTEVANGDAAPTLTSPNLRLAKVETDSSAVTYTLGFRFHKASHLVDFKMSGIAISDDRTALGNTTDTASYMNNIAIGNTAGQNNSSGSYNVIMIGYSSGIYNSGYISTLIGMFSGKNNTGDYCNFIGYQSGYSNTGDHCNFIGYQSGYSNTGKYNVFIGSRAGRYNTSGENNTFIGGYSAGYTNTTGSNNTCIGYYADVSAEDVSNEITLGDSNIATLRCNQTSITALSDRRDKADIKDLKVGIEFINSLRPVNYKWDKREWYANGKRDGSKKKDNIESGFIAQEVQESIEKYAKGKLEDLILTTNPNKIELKQGDLIPAMVQAIKDLKKEIDELKKEMK